MPNSKTINNVTKLEKEINKIIKEEDKKYLEEYFKTRFIRVEDKKITYPEKKEVLIKNKEHNNKLNNYKKEIKFWEKEKKDADNYYKIASLKKHFKKTYWAHKIKMMSDPEYKEDIEKSRLTEETLMDPKYEHLLQTFLTDSDYRKKLGDTVNNSIVYKNLNVGDANKKKINFKIETAIKKIEQLKKNIEDVKKKKKINNILLKYK
jgi:hypothetical protein